MRAEINADFHIAYIGFAKEWWGLKKNRILPIAALTAAFMLASPASADKTVKLLVNRNGIKNSFDVGSVVNLKKGDAVAVKDGSLGKILNGTRYKAKKQGTNKIYVYGKNGRRKKTIKVKQYKWIAHRGYSDFCVENTLDSIKAAAKAGAWGVELDLRLSSDGIPYVFHDETLQGKTNGWGTHDLVAPYSKLRKLEYRGFDSKKMKRTKVKRIPTFKECVETCRDLRLDVCVDVHPKKGKDKAKKYKKIAEAGAKVIRECGMTDRTMTVSWGGCAAFRKALGIKRKYNGKQYSMKDGPPF